MISSKSRHASSSYPAASLSFCLKKAALANETLPGLTQGIPRLWAPQDVFSKACGYSGFETNSAAKGLIASLTHFGLIENSQKKIRYRPDLISALIDENSLSILVKKCVKKPKIYQELIETHQKKFLCKDEIKKDLIELYNYAPRSAQILSANFIEDLALLKSVSTQKEAFSFTRTFKTPTGTCVTISSDKLLTKEDVAFISQHLK